MHLLRLRRHVAARVDIDMKRSAGRDKAFDFETGKLDQAVAGLWVKPGGFGVQDDLAGHGYPCPALRSDFKLGARG